MPWWLVVMGAFVAIAVAKMTFGGLGKNPFNPALVGRVFLHRLSGDDHLPLPVNGSFDVLSGATPLAAVKQGLAGPGAIGVQEMLLLGNIPGSLGEAAAALLLCGFVYLLWRRVITWHIPVTVLATMAVFAGVVAMMCSVSFDALPQAADGTCSAGYKLGYLFRDCVEGRYIPCPCGRRAMLGAIFMATDYSTSPMTVRGGVIFAVGIGLITMCIRLWGAYPEGMSFAILIMNACVPLINKYVKPKRFGVK